MSKFHVTTSELQSVIAALREENGQFRSRVNDLCTKQQELAGQWQGDANTAFNGAFQSDKGQWETFAQLVDQYIEALQSIMQNYDMAENTNLGTATTRSY